MDGIGCQISKLHTARQILLFKPMPTPTLIIEGLDRKGREKRSDGERGRNGGGERGGGTGGRAGGWAGGGRGEGGRPLTCPESKPRKPAAAAGRRELDRRKGGATRTMMRNRTKSTSPPAPNKPSRGTFGVCLPSDPAGEQTRTPGRGRAREGSRLRRAGPSEARGPKGGASGGEKLGWRLRVRAPPPRCAAAPALTPQ